MSVPGYDEPITYLTVEQIAAFEKEARILRARMVAHAFKVSGAFIINKLATIRQKLASAGANPAKDAGKAHTEGPVHSSMGAAHA